VNENKLDEHLLHEVVPWSTRFPCESRISQCAAPSHVAVTDPDTEAPRAMVPLGKEKPAWQPGFVVVLVVEVVVAVVLVVLVVVELVEVVVVVLVELDALVVELVALDVLVVVLSVEVVDVVEVVVVVG
jgi:hypothetical protein